MFAASVSGRKKKMKTVVKALIPASSHRVAAQEFQCVLYKAVSNSDLVVVGIGIDDGIY